MDKQRWAAVGDFDGELYQPADSDARITAIRECVEHHDTHYGGSIPTGRSLTDVVVENYRVLLRRIAELDADLNDLVEDAEGAS